jgi:hypothetical protein
MPQPQTTAKQRQEVKRTALPSFSPLTRESAELPEPSPVLAIPDSTPPTPSSSEKAPDSPNVAPHEVVSVSAPFSRFSAALLAAMLVSLGVVAAISARTVGRWLRAERLKPWRFRSWITPKDLSSFLERACPVLDLYERVRKQQLEPGEEVYSIDEKTSIQARDHATYQSAGQGEPARVENTYARRGAVQLIAALNVVSGIVFGQVFSQKSFGYGSSPRTKSSGNLTKLANERTLKEDTPWLVHRYPSADRASGLRLRA